MESKRSLIQISRLSIAAMLFATGCSPKIYTSITKTYPERPAGSYVAVLDTLLEQNPAAEPLGNVTVLGAGAACTYDEVLSLARAETNKVGGNGLTVTWHQASVASVSSCHRMAGRIYRLSDSLFYATTLQIARDPNHPATAGALAAARDFRHSNFHLHAGYAFIVNDIKVIPGLHGNVKQGFDLNAGYQWTSRKGIGVGIRYSGYFTSGTYESEKIRIRLHYIAPELVLRQDASPKCTFRETVGIGYANYSEGVRNISAGIGGFGFHVDLGVEYRPIRDLGLSLGVGAYSARFGSMDEYTDNDRKAGITRISLNGGLRVYF